MLIGGGREREGDEGDVVVLRLREKNLLRCGIQSIHVETRVPSRVN